jgi:hypothetical protein
MTSVLNKEAGLSFLRELLFSSVDDELKKKHSVSSNREEFTLIMVNNTVRYKIIFTEICGVTLEFFNEYNANSSSWVLTTNDVVVILDDFDETIIDVYDPKEDILIISDVVDFIEYNSKFIIGRDNSWLKEGIRLVMNSYVQRKHRKTLIVTEDHLSNYMFLTGDMPDGRINVATRKMFGQVKT